MITLKVYQATRISTQQTETLLILKCATQEATKEEYNKVVKA